MITVKIDEDALVEILMDRVRQWNKGEDVEDLFAEMYESMAYGGCFDDIELDISQIVDNDVVNNTTVVYEDDYCSDTLLSAFKNTVMETECGYIEAVDDESNPTMFLVRV